MLAYLRAKSRIGQSESPNMSILKGGISNKVVRVDRNSGESWVIKQCLNKLRVATDWPASPQRIHQEAKAIRWFQTFLPSGSVGNLIWEDQEENIIALETVKEPHQNWKTLLLSGSLNEKYPKDFGSLLGKIHRQGHAQEAEAKNMFGQISYFDSLRLDAYYRYSAGQCPKASDFYKDLINETLSTRITVVHGDYSPKNILIYEKSLILLDHEVIHWGDPAFDLGFAMTHFLSKANHLPEHRSAFIQATHVFWVSYLEALGPAEWSGDLGFRAAKHTMGCLLARVIGRSPLEYLNENEAKRQMDAVLFLLEEDNLEPPALADKFVSFIKD